MRGTFIVAAALLTSALSAQQIVISGNTFAVKASPGNFTNVPALGGGFVKGYLFTVPNIEGKALVALSILTGDSNSDYRTLSLYKRQTTNAYGEYCYWDQAKWSAAHSSGLLLEPGDYLFQVDRRDDLDRSLLLGGKVITTAEKVRHWQVEAGLTFGLHNVAGGAVYAFQFSVRANGDSLPVMDTAMNTYLSTTMFELYRQAANGTYYLYARIDPTQTDPTPGILLMEGEYLVRAAGNYAQTNHLRYIVMLSGRWEQTIPG